MKFYATILVLLSFQSQIISQQITFTDVAVSMGINHPIQFIRGSISFCDFNGDGKDDLYKVAIARIRFLPYDPCGHNRPDE